MIGRLLGVANVRAVGTVVLVALGGVALGACSSGSSSPSTSGTPATTGRSSTTTTSGSAPTSPSTSTTSGGPARCATTSLTGSLSGRSGAAGTIETTIALKSTSAAPCVLFGYPGLQMLNAGMANLPTFVVRKGNYTFTSMAPTTVTLTNGQTASFNIGYSDVPVGTETTCPTSAFLEVTPPNALDHLVIAAMLAPCGGGTLVVSPVYGATGSSG
ncbi:MAG: DUF4232 domain-containing protein [Acidimicrobiales bacterium]|nr:DUF4232 domain-containing protein [Acidimicrobiales bacterium]